MVEEQDKKEKFHNFTRFMNLAFDVNLTANTKSRDKGMTPCGWLQQSAWEISSRIVSPKSAWDMDSLGFAGLDGLTRINEATYFVHCLLTT
ncbi:10107_t:CDS:2 [Cetraspora pellucida]|uniref:10107_t:CDS:1 n=1 Tax=Cetraspora pellucida TaxID=1433469 RepID=A0A9N9NAY7_9GLOM|nr:10107_t:CDS:2 [Cetraspora pellucida]